MCLLSGVDAFDDDDADCAEEYTPLDDHEGEEEDEDDAAFGDDDVAGNKDAASSFAGDVDLSSDEEEHEESEDQDGDYEQGHEEEGEGSLELSLVPGRTNTMSTKEMRLLLIDQIYSEAQLRMLVEGCAIVDGIPPAAYACQLSTKQSRRTCAAHASELTKLCRHAWGCPQDTGGYCSSGQCIRRLKDEGGIAGSTASGLR